MIINDISYGKIANWASYSDFASRHLTPTRTLKGDDRVNRVRAIKHPNSASKSPSLSRALQLQVDRVAATTPAEQIRTSTRRQCTMETLSYEVGCVFTKSKRASTRLSDLPPGHTTLRLWLLWVVRFTVLGLSRGSEIMNATPRSYAMGKERVASWCRGKDVYQIAVASRQHTMLCSLAEI
jgi:hypothetical protein